MIFWKNKTFFRTLVAERVSGLAENAIDRVREAEVKADEALRAATQQAAQAVDNARTQAAELTAKAEDDAKQQAAGKVSAAHEESRKALQAAEAALQGEMDTLRAKAREAQPQAVEKILAALA